MSTPTTISAVNRRTPTNPSPSAAAKKLFTQNDEIDLLKSLLNNTTENNLNGQFSETQINDKIRRLKQKYQKQAKSKPSIKTPHDRQTYEISREIWGPKKTEKTPTEDEKKEYSEINWSDYPFLMRQISGAFPRSEEIYKKGLKGLGEDVLKGFEKKWMELEMEEAEIEAKKAQLFYNQMKD
ncbi:hypothetical protein DH2020_021182 [Rehmannia glutinosa]|uniref:Glabrous enhancer-binding protein-like DBD domain-containing protein n=1 Tax=Rehmannia glutinosa TaxID=99300 RepID=A0ABR0W9N7_REHGL